MASSSKARKSTSEDAHTSYQVYSGVEKAIVGVAKYIEFDLPKHDHIYDRLAKAGILSIISPEGFASFLIREFYNHLEHPNVTELDGGVRSRIQGQHVEITHVDLREEFGPVMSENMPDIVENYRKDRDWTLVNMSLHGNQKKTLTTEVTSLTPDAYLVQDIFRNSVMLKSGDTRSITAQLTLFTYYIMEDEPFDMADFILSQIRYTYRLKHPRWVKVHMLPMGLVIQRVLYKKYGWIVQDSYLDDCYPEIYFTGSMKGKKPQRKAQPGIEIREPSISRAGLLRESIDDLRDSLEDHKKEVKKDRSRMQKFMKFLVKGLKLKPTPEEEAEWQVPDEEPPRQSVRRTRRGKAVRRGLPEDCPESSGAGYEDSE